MHLFNRVRKLRPDVSVEDFVIQDDGAGPYIAVWKSSESKPSDDEIAGQNDTPSTADYSHNRLVSHLKIGDQLDMLFHDMTAGKGNKEGEWYKAVKAVKDANAKPG